MRKLYLLVFLVIGLFLNTKAQDSANFSYTVGPNNVVSFTNLSTIGGPEVRKAHWNFGTNIHIIAAPLANVSYQYPPGSSVFTACLKLYKYWNNNNDSALVSSSCKVVVLQNTTADSCKANFTDTTATTGPLVRTFVAQPWHSNSNKKPEQVCWNFGDGTTSCINYNPALNNNYNVTHTYAQAGNYNVCVKITYQGGCVAHYCRTVHVGGDPCNVNLFEVATNTMNPERHFYITTPPTLTIQKVCWYFGDGTDSCKIATPGAPVPLTMVHQYPSPGSYNACVKVWYTNGCVVQKCKTVGVHSNTNLCGGYMTDSLTGPKTYKFKGFSINNPNDYVVAWKWNFGDGSPIANGQQVSHTYANGGTYHVCLTIITHLGCETKICKPLVVAGNPQSALTLSPNPVTTTLNATFISTLAQPVTVTIYNSNGIAVGNYSMNAIVGTNNWSFNVTNLPPGHYSVVIHSGNQFSSATFIKQ